MSNPNNKTIV